jgi:hypothetical protein
MLVVWMITVKSVYLRYWKGGREYCVARCHFPAFWSTLPSCRSSQMVEHCFICHSKLKCKMFSDLYSSPDSVWRKKTSTQDGWGMWHEIHTSFGLDTWFRYEDNIKMSLKTGEVGCCKTQQWTIMFHKTWGFSQLSEKLWASQDRLAPCS